MLNISDGVDMMFVVGSRNWYTTTRAVTVKLGMSELCPTIPGSRYRRTMR